MPTRRKRRVDAGSEHGVRRAYSSPACYLHELEPVAARPAARGVQIKRIYEEADPTDGMRVLVDRLWPRGISKRRAAVDDWLADLAPSTALRQWFHYDLRRWSEFSKRYRTELRAQRPLLERLRHGARQRRVTLLYAARTAEANHALVLRDVLLRRSHRPRRSGT